MEKEQRLLIPSRYQERLPFYVPSQDSCNFPSVSVGLRPAVEILLHLSHEKSCRTKTARSSRGAQTEGEQGAKAVK